MLVVVMFCPIDATTFCLSVLRQLLMLVERKEKQPMMMNKKNTDCN
jgi:hypothetical protein